MIENTLRKGDDYDGDDNDDNNNNNTRPGITLVSEQTKGLN